MSGERYVPSSDNRFPRRSPPRPRARERDRNPAPDFSGVHPSRTANFASRVSATSRTANFAPRVSATSDLGDVPKGPRALADKSFGPAPLAPRGRTFPNRGAGRQDSRDPVPQRATGSSPPFDDRNRIWRERDPSTRERRSPPEGRATHLEPQERRDQYQDREADSWPVRRASRDAPAAIHGPGPKARPVDFEPQYRPDAGRGRGRGEWGYRGRGRGVFYDDRNTARPRSPSPRGGRWDREASRPLRADERSRDQWSANRAFEREDRDGTGFAYGRDFSVAAASTRRVDQDDIAASASNSALLMRSRDVERDSVGLKRPSSRSGPPRLREPQREEGGLDYGDGKPVQNNDAYSSRPSSPPRAPAVPAFGSMDARPLGAGQAANARQPPLESKSRVSARVSPPPPPPPPPPASTYPHPGALTDIPRLAPSAPKADFERPPPTGPKANRLSDPSFAVDRREATKFPRRDNAFSVPTGPAAPQPSTFTSPSSAGVVKQASRATYSQQPDTSISYGYKETALPPAGPKTGAQSNAIQGQSSVTGVTVPSGPRAGTSSNTSNASPSGLGYNVPTGPKATRVPPAPPVPRGPSGQSSAVRPDWQWNRPSGSLATNAIIPAKRGPEGISKEPVASDIVKARERRSSGLPPTTAPYNTESLRRNSFHETKTEIDKKQVKKPKLEETHESAAAVEDDDAVDIDEADIALNEEKFERDKAGLEARLTDLSSRHLRAATPLENLALLGRLALEDLSALFQQTKGPAQPTMKSQSVHKMEEESLAIETELLTPAVDTKEYVLVDRSSPPRITPSPVGSPELRGLPFLAKEPLSPFSDLEVFQTNIVHHNMVKDLLKVELTNQMHHRANEEDELRAEYIRLYRLWRSEVEKLDEEREREEHDTQINEDLNPVAVPTDVSPAAPLSALEPRRNRATFSEYDMARILEASLQTEREDQEKREKEELDARPNLDREAVVPEMLTESEQTACYFADESQHRDSEDAITLFELVPPADDFTKEEHETLVQNFREFPKKFGKLAQGLPGRTYKDCINHYYATKWGLEFKPPRMKGKSKYARSKARAPGLQGRPKANALISNLTDAKPDVYDGDETTVPLMAVTDSGRPRRAAAPIWPPKENEEQIATGISPAKKATKAEISIETSVEKSAKKPRIQTKERAPRKPRNQTIIRQPSLSPTTTTQDYNSRITDVTADGERIPSGVIGIHQSQISNQYARQEHSQMPSQLPIAEYHMHPGSIAPVEPSKATNPQTSRAGPSSYWSVQEVNSFPTLLQHFGTDWQSIANHMGTKSHTMVKNYFGRLMNTNDAADLEKLANSANERRERGDIPGPALSSSSSSIKKRIEATSSMPHHNIALGNEIIEVEDDSPPPNRRQDHFPRYTGSMPSMSDYGRKTPKQPPHDGSDNQFGLSSTSSMSNRFVYGQTSSPQNSRETLSQNMRPTSNLTTPYRSTSLADSSQTLPQGPRRSLPSEAQRSSLSSWDAQSYQSMSTVESQQSRGALGRTKEHDSFPVTRTGPSTAQFRQHEVEPKISDEGRYSQTVRPHEYSHGPPLLSRPLDASASFSHSKPSYDPARSSQMSHLIRDENRYAPAQSQGHARPAAVPKPENISKKSNIMDILNVEPVESRSSRPGPAPTPPSILSPRTHTPSISQYTSPYPPQRPLSQVERHESRLDVRRSPYQPGFASTLQTSSLNRPRSDHPVAPEAPRSESSRPSWLSHPTYPGQSFERPIERSPAFGHRSSIQALNAPQPQPLPPSAAATYGPPNSHTHTHEEHMAHPPGRPQHELSAAAHYARQQAGSPFERRALDTPFHDLHSSRYPQVVHNAPPNTNQDAHSFNAALKSTYPPSQMDDHAAAQLDLLTRLNEQRLNEQRREREWQRDQERARSQAGRTYSPFDHRSR
ncbi:MAG: hypothetical protein M1828_002312 [Chrysothrix sp. TS-e1954]|nr:MAG: hypothetical protein M1828_002312 [Chrysothrix sp. TS-e1954]